MSKVPDPSKLKEAQEELKAGQKELATGLMKWKPNYVDAEPHFQRAGRAFKSAGLMDSAVDAWRKAADCSYRMGNVKAASLTLENAGREVSMGKEQGAKVEACKLFAEAAGHLHEAGEVVRSCDLRLRAAKLVEGVDNDLALRMVDECTNLFDGDPEKDVYAVEPLRKIMQMQMALGKHASAMRTMDRLFQVFTRLQQPHNVNKLILSRVVLLLAAADPITAQREYEANFDFPGFTSSAEAAATEDLLSAYNDMDPEGMKKVLERSCFGFLEPTVTRVARQLPDAVLEGSSVGHSKPDEAATNAVSYTRAAPGQFNELGGTASVIGGGAGAAAAAGAAAGADDRASTKAKKAAAQDADLRANLFAKGPGGAGSAAPAQAAPAAGEGEEDDTFAFGEDAPDLDAALKDMNDGQAPAVGDDGEVDIS